MENQSSFFKPWHYREEKITVTREKITPLKAGLHQRPKEWLEMATGLDLFHPMSSDTEGFRASRLVIKQSWDLEFHYILD